jgi:hypothetical protein
MRTCLNNKESRPELTKNPLHYEILLLFSEEIFREIYLYNIKNKKEEAHHHSSSYKCSHGGRRLCLGKLKAQCQRKTQKKKSSKKESMNDGEVKKWLHESRTTLHTQRSREAVSHIFICMSLYTASVPVFYYR